VTVKYVGPDAVDTLTRQPMPSRFDLVPTVRLQPAILVPALIPQHDGVLPDVAQHDIDVAVVVRSPKARRNQPFLLEHVSGSDSLRIAPTRCATATAAANSGWARSSRSYP
jgi:hypothetical protein